MKYMKYIITAIVLVALLLIGFMIKQPSTSVQPQGKTGSAEHIYVSWDTIEFDKCVAAWLIVRFIDEDAQFRFVPKNTQIVEGIPFDIPGVDWSRKHRKCTSQCVLESIDNPDPAVRRIVSIASRTELNFWQLDRWPEAQKCFYEVKEIMDQTPDPAECIEKTRLYFDMLYSNFKGKDFPDPNT